LKAKPQLPVEERRKQGFAAFIIASANGNQSSLAVLPALSSCPPAGLAAAG
jgi:hypothetical protein